MIYIITEIGESGWYITPLPGNTPILRSDVGLSVVHNGVNIEVQAVLTEPYADRFRERHLVPIDLDGLRQAVLDYL